MMINFLRFIGFKLKYLEKVYYEVDKNTFKLHIIWIIVLAISQVNGNYHGC